MKKVLVLMGSLFFAATSFAANFCADPLIDELGVMKPAQVEQVAKVQNTLTTQGVESRVRIVSDFKGNASLEALKASAQQKCGSWKASDGGMKNNLLIIMVAPKQQKTGLFYGDALAPKLNPKQLAIQSGMNAKFRDGNIAAGVTVGLSDVSDLMSVKISQQGAPIVINHAADNSGFVHIFGWVVGLLVLFVIGFFVARLWRVKEKRRGAQQNAKTEQGRCSQLINGFETPWAVLKSRIQQSGASSERKATLLGDLARVKGNYDTASGEYSTTSRNNDPDVANLSEEEYEKMAKRYLAVGNRLENVMKDLRAVETSFMLPELPPQPPSKTAERKTPSVAPASSAPRPQKTSVPSSPAPRQSGYSSSRPAPAPARTPVPPAPAPEVHNHTTVVNNGNDGFLTGVIVGDILGRSSHDHHHHRDEAPVVRHEPSRAPAREDREEVTSYGRSSGGNGSETSWGGSSSGEARESSWGGSSFGESRAESPPPPPPPPSDCRASDCAASDCRSSDCAASDCAASDCAASDCNCDCSSSND